MATLFAANPPRTQSGIFTTVQMVKFGFACYCPALLSFCIMETIAAPALS
ncbi:hypothetical protein CPter291_0806 [Collimonas pratensis]|uniref:Uncharacterized protein n=1 Tax=Collimonas pratensis TaxID=279113 RepID=A0ABM5Z237_9BURK|nr:hypothetical protein CPter291_0806 [Collimonas pratensis]